MLLKIFRDKSAVTMMRLFFAAKQAAIGQYFSGDAFLNASAAHKIKEPRFVSLPVALEFLIFIQHLLRRGQGRQMYVIHPAHLFQEELEVVAFSEASQLRDIVE